MNTADPERREPTRVAMVHPADVNVADLKARAAEYGADVVVNRFVPRGQIYLLDPAVLNQFQLCGEVIVRTLPGVEFGVRADACARPKGHRGDHLPDTSSEEA